MPYREFDIVVYGATGFTVRSRGSKTLPRSHGAQGKLICEYLAKRSDGAKWAAAGRNEEKLRATLQEVGRPQQAIIVADANDSAAIEALVKRTQCVIAAAGPFMRYGQELVKHCANNGVHYFDLTGEPWFVNHVIQKHAKAALQHRAIIVNCAGMDSIPSDLGVYLACKALGSGKAGQVATLYKVKDKFSGGTFQSVLDFGAQPRQVIKEIMRNPYCLSPKRGSQKKNKTPFATRIGGVWGGMFPMAIVNQLIVQRTWGILETEPSNPKLKPFTYGPDFQYYEAMAVGGGPVGSFFVTLFLLIGSFFLALKPVAAVLGKIGPKSGSGATAAQLEKGYLHTITEAKSADGSSTAYCEMKIKCSPGYKGTAIMITESALAVVKDLDRLPMTARAGGPLTPATACGEVVVERLKKTGLFEFDVRVDGASKDE